MSIHMGTITKPTSEVEQSISPAAKQAGKGSRPRPVRLSVYQKNYERIFRPKNHLNEFLIRVGNKRVDVFRDFEWKRPRGRPPKIPDDMWKDVDESCFP